MNIKEFLTEQETLGNMNTQYGGSYFPAAYYKSEVATEFIRNQILSLDEFKYVKTLNFLGSPTFLIDGDNNVIDKENTTFVGGYMKSESAKSYSNIVADELNDIVDLYTINFSNPIYEKKSLEELEPGTWMLPSDNFSGERTIIIKYSKDSIGYLTDFTFSNLISNVSDNVKKLMTNDISNLKNSRSVIIRMSPRSVKRNPIDGEHLTT